MTYIAFGYRTLPSFTKIMQGFILMQNTYKKDCIGVGGGFWGLFFQKKEFIFNKDEEETPTQEFPCEYCKIFKNSFLYRTTPVAAFVSLMK